MWRLAVDDDEYTLYLQGKELVHIHPMPLGSDEWLVVTWPVTTLVKKVYEYMRSIDVVSGELKDELVQIFKELVDE